MSDSEHSPDVNSPEFKAEAERQARLIAADPHEAEIMAFIEAVADWAEDEPDDWGEAALEADPVARDAESEEV